MLPSHLIPPPPSVTTVEVFRCKEGGGNVNFFSFVECHPQISLLSWTIQENIPYKRDSCTDTSGFQQRSNDAESLREPNRTGWNVAWHWFFQVFVCAIGIRPIQGLENSVYADGYEGHISSVLFAEQYSQEMADLRGFKANAEENWWTIVNLSLAGF